MPLKKPRVIIAGQIPPPWGGQNIMVKKAVEQFARSERCESVHLPFFFTTEFKGARKASVSKVVELVRVIVRLLRIRLSGPVDLLLYPTGGPQKVPMIRDMLLLPWMLLLSRRVVLHFHAAGIADQLRKNPTEPITRIVSWLYSKVFAAVVMTNFNRRDPEAIGIRRIAVIPHRIEDSFDARLLQRGQTDTVRLLYVGHLCSDKGTPELLQAFAQVGRSDAQLELELVGECLPPFSPAKVEELLDALTIRSRVHVRGVLTGQAKAEAFARADVFVFPSIAPYESFGLVLVEAMEWALPIVASQWRGNLDVLTHEAGGNCFSVSDDLSRDIADALTRTLKQREHWHLWGKMNRRLFEQNYRDDGTLWIVDPILSLITPEGAATA